MEATRQLFQYAFVAGAPLAVLTDGGRWRFYSVMGVGKHEERLVRTLELEKLHPEEVTTGLVRYLSFENMISGEAWENAKKDLEEKKRRQTTNENISKAWRKMIDGPSPSLVDLLREETAEISAGFPPAREDVEKFIKNRGSIETSHGISPVKKPERPNPRATSGRKETEKKPSFILFGEEYLAEKDVASAFIEIIKVLARRDQNFLEQLAPEVAGKKNKPLSRNLEDLADYTRGQARQLPGGWWLTTHSSTDSKKSILRKACKIAGIPFGKREGLKLNF